MQQVREGIVRRDELEVIMCLGPVDAAAAEERAAQVGRAAAVLSEDGKAFLLLAEVEAAALHEAEVFEQSFDAWRWHNAHEVVVVLVEAAGAARGNLRADALAFKLQEVQHLARDGGVLGREIDAERAVRAKRDGAAHAQERRHLGRAVAGLIIHQSRNFVFYFSGKGWHSITFCFAPAEDTPCKLLRHTRDSPRRSRGPSPL